MVARLLLAAVVLSALTANASLGSDCSDPPQDQLGSATTPALDLVDIGTWFEPGSFVIELRFNPATTSPGDLDLFGGYIDIDTDSNPSTGNASYIELFGFEPFPVMGADFHLEVAAGSEVAELVQVVNGNPISRGTYPVQVSGITAKIIVPRCGAGPCNGITIGARFLLSAVVGNDDGPTDRIPNGEIPCVAIPAREDFDEDGDVDGNDLTHLNICNLGPAVVQYDPDCRNADLDDDGDVDQDDFGVFQRNFTGPR